MTTSGFALFDTAIGRCGIAWGERGVVRVQLPEARDTLTEARLRTRVPGAGEETPPPVVQRTIDEIVALLDGEPKDLSFVPLDMEGVPPFHQRVYQFARAIPTGATVSYGEIAVGLGEPGAARAVGQALGCNPFAIVVPCHRVVAAGGKAGGFSARGGVTTKLRRRSNRHRRTASSTFSPSASAGRGRGDVGRRQDDLRSRPRGAASHSFHRA